MGLITSRYFRFMIEDFIMEEIEGVCPYCEAVRNIRIEHKKEFAKVRKEQVEIDSVFSVCSSCGKSFVTLPQMEENLKKARSAYRQIHEIISPEEIIAIRTKYNVSQKALAKILDIGELTINEYEQGILPSGAHNSLLQLVKKTENFISLFEKNKYRLSERQIKKVETALARLQTEMKSNKAPIDEETTIGGYKFLYHVKSNFDYSCMFSLIQLVLFFAQQALYKTVLLKILFYIDFSHFKEYGTSITGWEYVKLPYGPVPDDYKDIFYNGEKLQKFTISIDEATGGETVSLDSSFDPSVAEADFSPQEITTIKNVTLRLKDHSAKCISELSHQEDAWKCVEVSKPIPYSFAKNLKLSV